jgi:hypothetical protein
MVDEVADSFEASFAVKYTILLIGMGSAMTNAA